MVRISRWMARNLHVLAARIERWSGAASTPPPAAPPLPDHTLQALAERFPGAPDHWLRMVAARMGMGALGATTGASRPAPMARQSPSSSPFPQPIRARRWPSPFGKIVEAGPPGQHIGQEPRAPIDPVRPETTGFPQGRRAARFDPAFPYHSSRSVGHSDGSAAQFPEPSPLRPRAAIDLPHDVQESASRHVPLISEPIAPLARSRFSPIGGEWKSGYEVRQPDELRNIWPELPPIDSAFPDAEPLLPDDDAIRLEQMVARWSA